MTVGGERDGRRARKKLTDAVPQDSKGEGRCATEDDKERNLFTWWSRVSKAMEWKGRKGFG